MAIDFLVFALLLVSFVINLLALAAFWITPGLRTTANRFTINLLIINIIGCLILAPTLFLSSAALKQSEASSSSSISSGSNNDDDSIELYAKAGNHQMIIRHNGRLIEQEGIIVRHNSTKFQKHQTKEEEQEQQQQQQKQPLFEETLYKCNSTFCKELTINESDDGIVITEFEEQPAEIAADLPPTISPDKVYIQPTVTMRCWSIDMAAALGALAVLLIVGDTWCAVTDPLRYHSRISGVKAWIFIALTWVLGIFFGALSAFRTLDFEADTVLSKRRQQRFAYTETYYSLYTSNGIFDMAFASIYFVVIILLPFGFVCGMYWRIFSEARENGLRMRQNGSSPLLQSALNLTQQQQQVNAAMQQYGNNYNSHRQSVSSASSSQGGVVASSGGLQMQLDQRKASPASMRRDSGTKVLLPTISDDGTSYVEQNDHLMPVVLEQHSNMPAYADRNQNNILLTLQSASGEIKRNYSARQLPLLGISSQDLAEADRLRGMRQVHSSPNLQKYSEIRQDSLTDETTMETTTFSAHLLGYNQLQLQRQHHEAAVARHHQPHHIYQSTTQQQRRHSHALQIPSASPKTCGYMSSLRHRLSNASSLFKYREESRAARISILVVFMFLVSYLPYGFLVLLQSRMPEANFAWSSELAIFMILLGNLTSPFIFAYRNKRVRRGVKRLFGIETHTHERSFHSQCGGTNGNGSNSARNRSSPAIIKRNSSKVSTYSLNSCKFITPQSSLHGHDQTMTTTIVATNSQIKPTLRPNSSCSTIINFMLTKHSGSTTTSFKEDQSQQQQQQQQHPHLHHIISMPTATTITTSATAATTTLIPAKPLATKPRNLFKLLFKSSQNLSRSVKSCTQGESTDAEPAEV